MSAPVPARCSGSSLYLPGWRSTLSITPLRWPLDINGTLCVHGALHRVASVGHDSERAACQKPLIVLIPRLPAGPRFESAVWDVHWLTDEAKRLQDRQFGVELWKIVRRLDVGTFHEMAVAIPMPGRYSVKVQATTPMLLKTTERGWKERLTPGDWIGAAQQSIRRFYGIQPWSKRAVFDINGWCVQTIEVDTRWSGRKIPSFLWKWQGTVDADTLLALRVMEQLGIGSTVSRGFGRFELC